MEISAAEWIYAGVGPSYTSKLAQLLSISICPLSFLHRMSFGEEERHCLYSSGRCC